MVVSLQTSSEVRHKKFLILSVMSKCICGFFVGTRCGYGPQIGIVGLK